MNFGEESSLLSHPTGQRLGIPTLCSHNWDDRRAFTTIVLRVVRWNSRLDKLIWLLMRYMHTHECHEGTEDTYSFYAILTNCFAHILNDLTTSIKLNPYNFRNFMLSKPTPTSPS